MAKVDKTDNCWLWMADKNVKGYGLFRVAKLVQAHRFSWTVFIGKIPEGAFVCHRCDNPPCVNSSHLFLGDAYDNMRDMISKGRGVTFRGESHSLSKLTDEIVRQIRSSSETYRSQSRKYGVDPALIRRVAIGKVWRHVV